MESKIAFRRPLNLPVESFRNSQVLAEKRETLKIPTSIYDQMLGHFADPATSSLKLLYSMDPITESRPLGPRLSAINPLVLLGSYQKSHLDDTSAFLVQESVILSEKKPPIVAVSDKNHLVADPSSNVSHLKPEKSKKSFKKSLSNCSLENDQNRRIELTGNDKNPISPSPLSNGTEKSMDELFNKFKAKNDALIEDKPKLSRTNSILRKDSPASRTNRRKNVGFSKHKTVYLIGDRPFNGK